MEHIPQIIAEAAKNPLGILALIVIVLAGVGFFFFHKAPLRLRVSIFVFMFVGFALFGFAIYIVEPASSILQTKAEADLKSSPEALNGNQIDKTYKEREREFRDAFFRLQRVNLSFDEGNIFETGAIALNVFALVHDASKSQPSALTLVGRKAGLKFVDTAYPLNPKNLLSEIPMVIMKLAPKGFRYLPILDKAPPFIYLQPNQPFKRWWNTPVIKSQDGRTYSRKNLILYFRDERGGHVGGSYQSHDGQPAADFESLGRENIGGWVYSDGTSEYLPEFGPEYATVRQIGWEVEQTLLRNYADLLMSPKPATEMNMKQVK